MFTKFKSILPHFIIPIIVCFFNIIILLFPVEVLQSSKNGVSLWFNIVLPSLFPFIVGTNILIHTGFVSFLGTLLEPIMMPIFNVSGSGGFALITGFTSGYPLGAKVTSDLYIEQQITKNQAQRLVSFTNNSGPLFIIGAVGIGMFKNAAIGYYILIVHYLSAIILGVFLGLFNRNSSKIIGNKRNIFRKAYKNMKDYQKNHKATFGKILAESVKSSMESMLIIGGFIILFSVINQVLSVTGFFILISEILTKISFGNIDSGYIEGFLSGLIEVTNGAKAIAPLPNINKSVVFVGTIITFGGFSIHAQSINFISKTDLSVVKYLIGKAAQSLIFYVLSVVSISYFNMRNFNTVSVFSQTKDSPFEIYIMAIIAFFIVVITCLFIGFVQFLLSLKYSIHKKHKKRKIVYKR